MVGRTTHVYHNRLRDSSTRRAEECSRSPNLVDVHVGRRVRQRRQYLGLSQGELGELLSLSFQQIQKYELGINRISASSLFMLSQALQTRIGWFFEDYDVSEGDKSPVPRGDDLFNSRETGELLRAYYFMSPRRQRLLLALALDLGADQQPPAP